MDINPRDDTIASIRILALWTRSRFERSRWRDEHSGLVSAVSHAVLGERSFGGGSYDPTSPAHAARALAAQLLTIHHPRLSQRRQPVRRVLPSLSGTTGSRAPATLSALLLEERKFAHSTVEMRISALRFLYKRTLKRRDLAFDDLIFPKVPHKLPFIFSQEEVSTLLCRGRESRAGQNRL